MDDSNNVITSNSHLGIKEYINNYFKLLECYYNLNKLKLNPDKSKLMIVCKPQVRRDVENIKLVTSDHVIKQVTKIKALGIFITNGLSNQAMVNNIISKVNFRLSVLRGIFTFCNVRTKTILMNSLVISIFRYCCPLLINSNINLISKLQMQLLKCTRYILGFPSFKMSMMSIMNKLKFMTVQHLRTKEAILFIHKILFNKSPESINDMISYSNDNSNFRSVRKARMRIHANCERMKHSLFYRSIFLYNSLDYDVRMFNPKKLSKYLTENIQYIFPHNKIPKEDNN